LSPLQRLGIKNVAQLQLPGLALAKSTGEAESRAILDVRVVSEVHPAPTFS